MKRFVQLFGLACISLFLTLVPLVEAKSPSLGYDSFISRHWLSRAEWLVHKPTANQRVYIRTKQAKRVIKAQILVDNKILVSPLGNMATTSIPQELAQAYKKSHTDIQVFPVANLRTAKDSIVLGLTLENDRQKRFKIQGKTLQDLLKLMNPSTEIPTN